jgi:hypothetical protein
MHQESPAVAERLQCVDLWGREVVLYGEVWHDHILADHAELAVGDDTAIALTLGDPDYVTRDVSYPNGVNYYRRNALATAGQQYFLKVCVRFPEPMLGQPRAGSVVTAYPTFTVKRAETVQWSRTTSR